MANRFLENLAIQSGRSDILQRRLAEQKRAMEEANLEQNRQALLAMQAPVQPNDLVSALTESMSRAGQTIPPTGEMGTSFGEPFQTTGLAGLLQSAGQQDLGMRNIFTPQPTVMSQGLPFMSPEFMPTQAGMQADIEKARMPQSQVRLLEALNIAKAMKVAKETTRGQYVKTAKGGLQWRNVDESGNIPLQKGDIPVGTDISQAEWTGGAMNEVQIMNGLKLVDNQAMKHANEYVRKKYGTRSGISLTIDANGNPSINIGATTSPEQLLDYETEYASFGKRFSSQLNPQINKMFLNILEAKTPSGKPEKPKTDQQIINDLLTDTMFDPKIKAHIRASISKNVKPAAIVAYLRKRQLIK